MTKARWMCRFWYIITFFSWECIVIKQSNNAGKTWVVAIWVMKLQMTQVSHDTHNRSTKRFACILLHAILDYTGLHWVLYHKCWVYVNWTVDAIVTALGRLGLWDQVCRVPSQWHQPFNFQVSEVSYALFPLRYSVVWQDMPKIAWQFKYDSECHLCPFPSKVFNCAISKYRNINTCNTPRPSLWKN